MKGKTEQSDRASVGGLLDAIVAAEQEVFDLTYDLAYFNDRKTMVQTEILGECLPTENIVGNPHPVVWQRMWADQRWKNEDENVRQTRVALDKATVRLHDLERRLHYAHIGRYVDVAEGMAELARLGIDVEAEGLARAAESDVVPPSV